MKKFQLIAALIIALGAVGNVWADMAPTAWTGPQQLPATKAETFWVGGQPVWSGADNGISMPADVFTSLPISDLNTGYANQLGQDLSKELPGTPSSALLFLCGLSSIGAFQLTQSARKLHFGDVPQWLHTGGPSQIGHRLALDSTNFNVLLVCWFQQPGSELLLSVGSHHTGRDVQRPPIRQDCLAVVGPRSPPALV